MPFEADTAIETLRNKGVDCRPFFWCMHEQPVLNKTKLFKKVNYPIAEKLARRGFYIPSGIGLKDNDLIEVCNVLHEVFCEYN